jgi:hypothetical protein
MQGKELLSIKRDFEAIENDPNWLESVYGFTNFTEYIISPREQYGLHLNIDTVRQRVKVSSKFIDELGMEPDDEKLKEVSWGALNLISRLVTEENLEEWLDNAKFMKFDDLKSEIAKFDRDNAESGGSGGEGEGEGEGGEGMSLRDKIKGLPAKNAKRILETLVMNIEDKLPNLKEKDKGAYEGVLKMIDEYIELD